MGVIGFLGIVVVYTMRACLSVAITEMVVPLNNTSKGSESLICQSDSLSVENSVVPVSIFMKKEHFIVKKDTKL